MREIAEVRSRAVAAPIVIIGDVRGYIAIVGLVLHRESVQFIVSEGHRISASIDTGRKITAVPIGIAD